MNAMMGADKSRWEEGKANNHVNVDCSSYKLNPEIAKMFDKGFDIIKDMSHDQYGRLVASKTIREEIVDELLRDSKHRDVKKFELVDFLEHSDKELFRNFRDHIISMSQLKARVYKRRFKVDYTCFDDMIKFLDPAWLDEKERAKFRPKMKMIFGENFKPEDVLRSLVPYECDDHCLKSLRYHVIHPARSQTTS